MDGFDFVAFSGLAAGLAFLAAAALGDRGRTGPPSPGDDELEHLPTRWRRYRLAALSLLEGEPGGTVLAAEAPGLELRLVRGGSRDLPLELAGASGVKKVRVERRYLSRSALRVRIERKPWLSLRLRSGEFPELESEVSSPEAGPAAERLELTGDLASREYEVRLDGRLAASVSWQAEEPGVEVEDGSYFVEVVASAPQEPLLALALALEAAAALGGEPPRAPAAAGGEPTPSSPAR